MNTSEFLIKLLRPSSLAKIGGFAPKADSITSWFGGPFIGLPGEELPRYQNTFMFPLLQIRVDELPYIPTILQDAAFLIVFINGNKIPFSEPHGNGWFIREYKKIDNLQVMETSLKNNIVKSFQITWGLAVNDTPGYEDLLNIVNQSKINISTDQIEDFLSLNPGYSNTKVGGYPFVIQNEIADSNFLLQIDSEEKANWQWGDGGIGYFFKNASNEYSFKCQVY